MIRSERFRWIVCGLLFLATTLSFLDRQVLSVLAPKLMSELSMTSQTYSRIVSAFMLSYTLMLSLGGYLLDRFGSRRGLALSVGVWSVSCGAHAMATGGMGLGIARFFLGVGEGACIPGMMKCLTEWFPLQKRALAIGLANSGATMGALLAPPLTVFLAGRWGWRSPFLVTGFLGILWMLAWGAVFRGAPAPAAPSPAGVTRKGVGIREMLRDDLAWRAMAAKFLFDPVTYFYMFWIPQYLTRERGFTLEEVGAKFWMLFLASGLSSVAAGRLSDRLVCWGWKPRRARATLLVVAAAVTPVSWLVALAPNASVALALMCVLMLAKGLWQTNFLAFLSDGVPVGRLASVTGVSGTAGGIGGMVSSLLIGAVVDRFSFTPVFAVSAAMYPLAAVILLVRPRQLMSRGRGRTEQARCGQGA